MDLIRWREDSVLGVKQILGLLHYERKVCGKGRLPRLVVYFCRDSHTGLEAKLYHCPGKTKLTTTRSLSQAELAT